MKEHLVFVCLDDFKFFKLGHRTKKLDFFSPRRLVGIPMWAIRVCRIDDVLNGTDTVGSEAGAHQGFRGWGSSPF